MGAPWTKYADQSAPSGPWQKYATPESPKAEPEKPGFFGRAYEASAKPFVEAVKSADAGGYGPYGKAVNAAAGIVTGMGKAIAERGAPAVAYDAIGDVIDVIKGDVSEGNYGGAAGTVVGMLLPLRGKAVARGTAAAVRGTAKAAKAGAQTIAEVVKTPGFGTLALRAGETAGGLGALLHGNILGALPFADGVVRLKSALNNFRDNRAAVASIAPVPTPPVPSGTFTAPPTVAPVAAPAPLPAAISANPAMLLNPPVAAPVRTVPRPEPAWRRAVPPQAAQPAAESSTIDDVTAELQRRASIREARRRAAAQQQATPPQQPAAAPTPAVAQPTAPVAQAPAVAAPVAEASMDDALAQQIQLSIELKKLAQPGESIADVARRIAPVKPNTPPAAPAADDLIGQIAEGVRRKQAGLSATPPEQIEALEQASAASRAEIAENASRPNRTARGNFVARELAKKLTPEDFDALVERVPLAVDQADNPIWDQIAGLTQPSTVPTTRAGRLEIVKGIQRQQRMSALTAPPAEAQSLDDVMQQVAVKPAPVAQPAQSIQDVVQQVTAKKPASKKPAAKVDIVAPPAEVPAAPPAPKVIAAQVGFSSPKKVSGRREFFALGEDAEGKLLAERLVIAEKRGTGRWSVILPEESSYSQSEMVGGKYQMGKKTITRPEQVLAEDVDLSYAKKFATEHLSGESTLAKQAEGMPIAEYKPGPGKLADIPEGRFEYKHPVEYGGSNWTVTGHYIIKAPIPSHWKPPTTPPSLKPPQIGPILADRPGRKPVTPVAFERSTKGGKRQIVFSDESVVDADYYDAVVKMVKPDQWKSSGPKDTSVVALKNGEVVAVIAGMRDGAKGVNTLKALGKKPK